MEIGEYQLSLADELVLRGDGLLHLDNHLGRGIDRLDVGQDAGADRFVGIVGESAVYAGRRLDEDRVSALDELLRAGRSEGHAILVVLDLFGNADNHSVEVLGGFR